MYGCTVPRREGRRGSIPWLGLMSSYNNAIKAVKILLNDLEEQGMDIGLYLEVLAESDEDTAALIQYVYEKE